MELLWQIQNEALTEKNQRAVRASWDDLARELLEILFFFFLIRARETPLVSGITGDGNRVKTTLSLGILLPDLFIALLGAI